MLEGVYRVAEPAVPVSVAEVRVTQDAVGGYLPDGYEEFVTWFGEGTLSDWVRVYPPARILAEYQKTQSRWLEYFFWDGPDSALTKEQVLQCVLVGDTLNGDELIFSPGNGHSLFVLPRDDDRVIEIPGGLEESIHWLCSSGVLTSPISMLWFEPWANRDRLRFVPVSGGQGTKVGFARLSEAISVLAVHDQVFTSHDEDGQIHRFFVPALLGCVTVMGFDDEIMVAVEHDATGVDHGVLERITQVLTGRGLVLQG